MRLTLPILLFMSVLSTTAAARHHRGTLMNSPRRDTNTRRRAKEGDDETEQMMKNLKVKVSKSTGEITVSRAKMSKTKDKASAVKILINKIVEVDEDGNPVGTNEEGVKHSISPSEDMKLDVEVQAYTAPIPIEEEDEVDVDADVDTEVADENEGNEIIDTTTPGTDSVDLGTTEDETNPTAETDTVDDRRRYLQEDTNPAATGLNVTMFGSLQGDSNIRVEMWLISGGGVVGTQTERWVVQPSDMKFNILMENWNFCDPCEDSTVGKYLDVHIQIKGGKSPKRAKGSATIVGRKNGVVGNAEENEGDEDKGKAWDIGDGTMLDFSSVVTINGVETTMPDKYPEFVSDGNTQYYILRFPKFDDLRYDPVVTFDEDYDSAATFQLVSHTTTFGAMLLAYVLLL